MPFRRRPRARFRAIGRRSAPRMRLPRRRRGQQRPGPRWRRSSWIGCRALLPMTAQDAPLSIVLSRVHPMQKSRWRWRGQSQVAARRLAAAAAAWSREQGRGWKGNGGGRGRRRQGNSRFPKNCSGCSTAAASGALAGLPAPARCRQPQRHPSSRTQPGGNGGQMRALAHSGQRRRMWVAGRPLGTRVNGKQRRGISRR